MKRSRMISARCFHRCVSIAIAASYLSAPSVVASTCTNKCDPPAPRDPKTSVTVDVTTQKLSGPRSFPENTAIEVILKNKNPFRYEYSLAVDTQFVDRDTLRDALTALNFPTFEALLEQARTAAKSTTTKPPPDATRGLADACTKLLSPYTAPLDAAYPERITELNAASTAAEQLKKYKDQYLNFESKVKESNISTIVCPEFCDDAEAAVEGLKGLIASNELGRSVTNLTNLRSAIASLPTQARLALNDAQEKQCSEALVRLTQQSTDFANETARLTEAYKQLATELADQRASYKQAFERLQSIRDSNTAFASSETIQPSDEPVKHTLSLTIKDKLDAKAPAQVFPLGDVHAGRPRLTFSLGPALSFIDQREFGRQAGLVPDGSGGSTLGSVVAVTDESDTKLAFVGQLNARVAEFPWLSGGVHLTFGASVGSGESADDIGLFLGPSLSLRKDLVFLTLAYHYQETRKLGATFGVGQPVPADLEGEIPTSTKRVGGLLLTLTIRAR